MKINTMANIYTKNPSKVTIEDVSSALAWCGYKLTTDKEAQIVTIETKDNQDVNIIDLATNSGFKDLIEVTHRIVKTTFKQLYGA